MALLCYETDSWIESNYDRFDLLNKSCLYKAASKIHYRSEPCKLLPLEDLVEWYDLTTLEVLDIEIEFR